MSDYKEIWGKVDCRDQATAIRNVEWAGGFGKLVVESWAQSAQNSLNIRFDAFSGPPVEVLPEFINEPGIYEFNAPKGKFIFTIRTNNDGIAGGNNIGIYEIG